MENKNNNPKLNIEKEAQSDFPGYPHYPPSEDIYVNDFEEEDIDLEDTSEKKTPIEIDNRNPLNEKDFELPSFESKIFIRHFISQLETLKEKNENWYKQPNLMFSLTDEDSFKEEIISKCIAPSQVKGFSNWKAYNPQRDLYE